MSGVGGILLGSKVHVPEEKLPPCYFPYHNLSPVALGSKPGLRGAWLTNNRLSQSTA